MATPEDWLDMAVRTAQSAQRVEGDDPRSAASRFYFAAYQAAHAIALHAGVAAPDRGNWPHSRVPIVLFHAATGRLKRSATTADVLRRRLTYAQRSRVFADYVAESGSFERQSLEAARDAAASRGTVRPRGHPMSGTTPNGAAAKLTDAVKALEGDWRDQLEKHGVRLATGAIEQEFGVWVIPIEIAASGSRNSWAVEEFLRKIEFQLEESTGERITLFLDA